MAGGLGRGRGYMGHSEVPVAGAAARGTIPLACPFAGYHGTLARKSTPCSDVARLFVRSRRIASLPTSNAASFPRCASPRCQPRRYARLGSEKAMPAREVEVNRPSRTPKP